MVLAADDLRWKLEPGESFQTPEAVLVYSREGFNGMSQEFHRLHSPSDGDVCAWMLTDRKRKQTVIYAFVSTYNTAGLCMLLKIPYLNPKRIYVDVETGQRFSGEELRYAGLALRFPQGDFPVVEITLRAEAVDG